MEVCTRSLAPVIRRRGATAVTRRRTCFHHRRPFTTTPSARDDTTPSSTHQRSAAHDDISSLLDSALDFDKVSPTTSQGRTSHFKAPSMQTGTGPTSSRAGAEYRPREGSSLDEIFSAMGRPGARGAGKQSTSTTGGHRDISRMLDASSNFLSTRNNKTGLGGPPSPPALLEKTLPIKLNASVGRRIEVQGNVDTARAFRQLEVQCARNSVRKDFGRQRFHERPGLKRKRLKGERWRRRFREGFRGVIALVGKMRRQGW